MDEEQAALEQLSLTDIKKCGPTALKTFNNYAIIMTNNGDKIRISRVWCFCLWCLFLS